MLEEKYFELAAPVLGEAKAREVLARLWQLERTMSLAQALFAPARGGADRRLRRRAKNTARPQRYLKKHGYAGKVFPVNPGAQGSAGREGLAAA